MLERLIYQSRASHEFSSLHLFQLLRDERHHDVLLINRHPVSARRFPEWSMAFSSYPSLHVQGMTGFFPVDEQGQGHMVAICGESAG